MAAFLTFVNNGRPAVAGSCTRNQRKQIQALSATDTLTRGGRKAVGANGAQIFTDFGGFANFGGFVNFACSPGP